MEAILYTRRLTWRKNRIVKELTVMILMFFAMYTEAGLRSPRSVETTPDGPAPQIIFQEKTVTTENDVIHVQRLLDEKEVSIVL